MGQRKLTDEELQDVMHARHYLRKVTTFADLLQSRIAMKYLDLVATHGTTDGKPYVEPQPEIGDGYRVATASDIDRRDVAWWDARTKRWEDCGAWSAGMPFDSGRIYRVPVIPEIGEGYRVATESDAWRKDVEYFSNLKGNGWFPRAVHGKPLESF